MSHNTCVIRVGRLLEVCIDAGYTTTSDVDGLFDKVERELTKLPDERRKYAVIVDWTRCRVMSPTASERLLVRMARTNRRIVRSAVLAAANGPSAVLQFLRVIREARQLDRKLFFDGREIVPWLGEVLTDDETERLRTFLSERSKRHTDHIGLATQPESDT